MQQQQQNQQQQQQQQQQNMIRQRPKGTITTMRTSDIIPSVTATTAANTNTTATANTATSAAVAMTTTKTNTNNAGMTVDNCGGGSGRHVTITFDQAPKTRIVASSSSSLSLLSSPSSSRRRNTKLTSTAATTTAAAAAAAAAAAGHHHQQQLQQPHVAVMMDHSFHQYPSQCIAPMPKPFRMILDKEYKDFYYMRGSIQQQQQQQRKGTKVVIWTPFCAAKTCSYISLVGTLFLVRF